MINRFGRHRVLTALAATTLAAMGCAGLPAEFGPAGAAVHLDQSAMVANDLRHQS